MNKKSEETAVSFPIPQYKTIKAKPNRIVQAANIILPMFIFWLFFGGALHQRSNYVKTTGIVLNAPNKKSSSLIIKYEVGDGYLVLKKHPLFYYKKPGDSVKVVYRKSDPYTAYLDSFFGYWMPPNKIMMFIIAIVAGWGLIATITFIFVPGKLR